MVNSECTTPRILQKPAPEPVALPVEHSLLTAEIAFLRRQHLTFEQSNYEVFVAGSTHIPNVLLEIGRLREVTFRSVGEGTGRSRDLDEFDAYYRQLIIWDKTAECIAGGYRLGCGEEIFPKYGVDGFYISSLFHIREGFFPILGQALELGRSYIVEAYQRKPLPLFLLWKGILAFLLQHPQYRYILGPVSISRQFSDLARGLMVGFLEQNYYNESLAAHLSPRTPFKVESEKDVDISRLIESMAGDLATLDKFIEGVETKGARLPVLLRQYLRQNARFIGFNLDPNFSDCLDGFMILDMNDLPASTIENLQRHG
ncbi:MAG TPA: GNAT family N-acyltransferase [Saprospiraceae bacterium]|nr:GNAT family N-acyltransferase [Saprospiraceae bacterium]